MYLQPQQIPHFSADRPPRCISSRTSLPWLVGLAAWGILSAADGQAAGQNSGDPRLVTLDVRPLVIVVSEEQSGPVEKESQVELTKEIRQYFPADNPVLWSFEEEQEPLRPVLTDPDAMKELLPIAVGRADLSSDAQVRIRHDPEPLNEPRRFWLTIPQPRKLKPGAYTGKIVFRVETFSPRDLVVRYAWPVHLYVEGRQVLNLRFTALDPAAAQATLRVGQSASVTLLVHTVGASMDLGKGQLELQWKRDPNSDVKPDPILRLPLPAPTKPIDPAIDFEMLEQLPTAKLSEGAKREAVGVEDPKTGAPGWPRLLCRPEEWRRELLWGLPVKTRYEQVQDNVKVGLYEIETRLPEVLFNGTLTAHVVWERLSHGGPANPLRVATRPARIQPGIGVWPRHALVGERVLVVAVADEDLGNQFSLMLYDGHGQPIQDFAMHRRLAKAGSVDAGFRYEGVLTAPRSMGPFKVGLVDSTAPGLLAALVGCDAQFRVLFGLRTNLNKPLIAFAGDPPFWWDVWHHESGGWGTTRKNAILLVVADAAELKDVFLKGVYALDVVNRDGRPLRTLGDFDGEPELVLSDAGQSYTVPGPREHREAPDAAPGDAGSDTACLLRFPLAEASNKLAVDLGVGLDESGKNVERNRNGVRTFSLRITVLAVGRASSDPVAAYRTVEIPFRVKVASSWEYNWPLVAVVGVIGALVLIGWLVRAHIRGKVPPPPPQQQPSGPVDPLAPGAPSLHFEPGALPTAIHSPPVGSGPGPEIQSDLGVLAPWGSSGDIPSPLAVADPWSSSLDQHPLAPPPPGDSP